MRLLGKYLAMKALDLSPTQMTLVLAVALGGHLLQVGPDGFADGGVHTTSQASVRGDGHKFLGCSLAQLTSAWSKKMEAASLSRLPLQEALPPSDPSQPWRTLPPTPSSSTL